jgi:acetoin utilization deacetylase AcuC-like enzyme
MAQSITLSQQVDGSRDEEYLPLLEKWLAYLMSQHQPQIVYFQAGVDALQGDRYGLWRKNL